MNKVPFKGVIAYPVTPFDDNENVDIPLFKKQVERLVTTGSHGIAPLGSTGVMPYCIVLKKVYSFSVRS